MDLYNKLKGVDLGRESDDYFRNLGFNRGRQDAIDFMSRMRDQDPAVQASRQAETLRIDTRAREDAFMGKLGTLPQAFGA